MQQRALAGYGYGTLWQGLMRHLVVACATILLVSGGDNGAHAPTTKTQANKTGIAESLAASMKKFTVL